MTQEKIVELINSQRDFFATGKTLSIDYRIQALDRLKNACETYKKEVLEALKTDLGKGEQEAFMCEFGLALSELSYMKKHVKRYARDKRVLTPLTNFAAKSFVRQTPYGNVLIMSPWNYPFLLTIEPLVDALAAGNTAIVKPSAYSPATSKVLSSIIKEAFRPDYVATVEGGRAENQYLLDEKYDYIFFTGSQTVGREVMEKASRHLTPVTLELGGKSPCIIEKSADLKLAAKRVVFGKYLNCGQTCVAPDYILCQEEVKDEFIRKVKEEIVSQFGTDPLSNEAYGKIINEKHFNRIKGLIDTSKIVAGGNTNSEKLKIEPTVMDNISYEDVVMQEEIFGPVMPVISFKSIDDVITDINSKAHPLALYIFTADKEVADKVTRSCKFGGGCINDTIIHLACSSMGFGGVGESGMGAYHGKAGFETFSHQKSIVDKKCWIDLSIRYQPYNKMKLKLISIFLK